MSCNLCETYVTTIGILDKDLIRLKEKLSRTEAALARLNAIDWCMQCPACDKHAKAALADIDRIAKEKNEP